jgi:nicotinate-nucleotide adenylyltransferase
MNLGVLGGTFDPIHSGHIIIAEKARKKFELTRVLFVPAGQPWLKADREITPAVHRVEMVRRAIGGNMNFELSTVEVDRSGPSLSVETVAILKKQLGAAAMLFFLVGWDSLAGLYQWKEPSRLVKMCKLVAVNRPGFRRPDLKVLESSVPGVNKSVVWMNIEPVHISSSDIRKRVARGLPIHGMVPEAVESYIKENNLYSEKQKAG